VSLEDLYFERYNKNSQKFYIPKISLQPHTWAPQYVSISIKIICDNFHVSFN